ncbi:TonB-dependent receptor [Aestuariivivens sediminis]|uniref:TonB-dependent receptor n=1 Tax=Aestuariivivens sediminis TaxID=2913557 RepID=UPI001F57EAFB|nr:TonB-dependent receptor [Aestuariivivens sediminis]
MKVFVFLCVATVFSLAPNNVISQNSKVKIDNNEILTVDEVFDLIMDQTDYKFIYQEGIFKDFPKVQVKKGVISTNKLLRRSLTSGNFEISISENNTVLVKLKEVNKTEVKQERVLNGKVTDTSGVPLPGANIQVKDTSSGTTTNFEGNFSLTVSDEAEILVVSYVGYKTKEVIIGDQSTFNIILMEDAAQLDAIVLTGFRGSLAKAITQKRNATSVVDGIAAKDIADFPDLNISESLGRITGVTINRVLGEGQQVSVRGLAPEFTRVTINGQTVASGNPGREVDFDVFASELFNNVQLSKSPEASMTEGGLAATIDLRTARPFDYSREKPVFAASAQGVYNDLKDDVTPRLSFLASTNSLAGGKLGLLASVSYSESSLRQDNAEGLRFLLIPELDIAGDGTVDATNVEIPFIPRYVLEFLDRDRLGVTGALQFKPNDNFDLNLDVAYAKFNELRTRHSIDGVLNGDRSEPIEATIDNTGLVTMATYDNVSSRSENLYSPSEEDLLLLNLDGTWMLKNNWYAKGNLGYSNATKKVREFRAVYNAIDRFSYDFTDRIFVGLHPENTDFTDPNDFRHNQSRFINDDIDDKESSIKFDLIKNYNNGLIRSFSWGARYSNREKSSIRYDGSFTATDTNGDPLPVGSSVATNLPVNDFFSQYDSPNIVRNWFVADFDAVFDDPVISGANFNVPQRYISTFAIEEKTFGAYFQADFKGEVFGLPMRGNAGFRYVSTDQTSNGFLGDGTPVSIGQTYSEFLPSLNTVLNLDKDLLFRFTASRTLTRPTLTSLTPGGTVAPGNAVPGIGGGTANLGNPELKPFTATQFDLALEWYFSKEGLASFTFFNKKVDNFITSVTNERLIDVGSLLNDNGEEVGNSPFIVTQPVNGEGATITGFEISLQLPFTFLPKPLDGMGALINYTYSDSESEITFNNQTVKTLLPGQAKTSFNLVTYYEKGPFSTRLAYTWRDKLLYEVRSSSGQRSNFLKDYGQLDANIQYSLTDNIILIGNALNLTGEETYRYAEREDRNIAFSETGRFFTFGVRAKF